MALTRTRGVLFAVLTAILILAGWWKLGIQPNATAEAQSTGSGHKSVASTSPT